MNHTQFRSTKRNRLRWLLQKTHFCNYSTIFLFHHKSCRKLDTYRLPVILHFPHGKLLNVFRWKFGDSISLYKTNSVKILNHDGSLSLLKVKKEILKHQPSDTFLQFHHWWLSQKGICLQQFKLTFESRALSWSCKLLAIWIIMAQGTAESVAPIKDPSENHLES